MATGLWGSICLEDLFQNYIAQSQDGRKWVNLDALNQAPFQVSPKNGKHYVGINIWINDELDKFNNAAGISLSQTQDQRNAGQKRVYIGNLKYNQQQQQAAYPQQQPAQQSVPPMFGGAPAPQPAYAQPQPQPFGAPQPQQPVYNNAPGNSYPAPQPQPAYNPQPVTQQQIQQNLNPNPQGFEPLPDGLPF